MSHDIFISYSHEDQDFIIRLRDDLMARGFDVWIDHHSLVPGTPSWERAIEKRIVQASFIIIIMSADAKNSLWVTREIAVAEGVKKKIIPILIKGDEISSVPFRLISIQRIDARQEYPQALNALCNTCSGKNQEVRKRSTGKAKSRPVVSARIQLFLPLTKRVQHKLACINEEFS